MVRCVVSGCPSRSTTDTPGVCVRPGKRFFRFPADQARVKVWLAALRETDKQDWPGQHVICEDHFLPEDISRDQVDHEAIPIMPPLDAGLGLTSPWGGAGTSDEEEEEEEEEQWTTRGCEDEDEGGEAAPPAPPAPPAPAPPAPAPPPPPPAPPQQEEEEWTTGGCEDEGGEAPAPPPPAPAPPPPPPQQEEEQWTTRGCEDEDEGGEAAPPAPAPAPPPPAPAPAPGPPPPAPAPPPPAPPQQEEEQWTTRGCEDEGGEAPAPAPPPPPAPPQQGPEAGLENPPEPQTSSAAQPQRKGSRVSRHDTSLVLLTQGFLELLLAAPGGSLDLRQVAASLKIRKRRVYDITNILDGIQLIQKESTNRIKWIGKVPISNFLRRNQQRLQKELENLKLVEDTLDGLIKSCAQQLFDMTDDPENSASAYVTLEDVGRLRVLQEKTLLVIKAPEETKLEIPAPKEDSIQVHLKAGKGPITVVTREMESMDAMTSDPGRAGSGFFLTLEESRVRTSTLHRVS